MNEPIVSVRDLSHRYSKDWAVRHVAFEINKPGIVGLLGSNGAGKSTTMNIMCGVLYPTEGDVLINGKSIREEPLEAKREIGFLPQQAPLYTEFTVEEYLRHCAALRRLPAGEVADAVGAAMERCGVAHFCKRLIGALSGGFRQRVGLAQAILHQPALVVLDEPTNGLDPNQILAVRELIKEIAAERTLLISTHILPEVEALCDDIMMIEQGRIVFDGSMEAFASVVKPRSLIVRFDNPPGEAELLALPGVESVAFLGPKKARLVIAPDTDISDELVLASVAGGWRLRELSFERSTLEQVFARLSGNHVAEAA
ncbi:MAG: ABC transporter ATP-binding protein [Sphingomonadales bacterium]|nr:ABC transporter ATP-binding protein [Sphingomonadales bacterium]